MVKKHIYHVIQKYIKHFFKSQSLTYNILCQSQNMNPTFFILFFFITWFIIFFLQQIEKKCSRRLQIHETLQFLVIFCEQSIFHQPTRIAGAEDELNCTINPSSKKNISCNSAFRGRYSIIWRKTKKTITGKDTHQSHAFHLRSPGLLLFFTHKQPIRRGSCD